jgi:hypothetical protein
MYTQHTRKSRDGVSGAKPDTVLQRKVCLPESAHRLLDLYRTMKAVFLIISADFARAGVPLA